MENLIYRETKVITPLATKHPLVLSIWESGSLSASESSRPIYHIHIILKWGDRKEFKGEEPDKVLAEAEAFIQSIKIII